MLSSGLNHNSDHIQNEEVTFQSVLEDFYLRYKRVLQGGSEKAVALHRSRGKLTARERIENLLDKDSPFLELSALAAMGQYHDQFPAAGVITGIGKVQGRYMVIVANDATVKGGTYIRETIRKHCSFAQYRLCEFPPGLGQLRFYIRSKDSRHFADTKDYRGLASILYRGVPTCNQLLCQASGDFVRNHRN